MRSLIQFVITSAARSPRILFALVFTLALGTLPAQSSVRGWGGSVFDSAWNEVTDYVEIAAGGLHTVARRSDGSVVAWGSNGLGQTNVPALPTGLTYVEVSAGGARVVARLGPTSTYTHLGAGCAGSLPAARLVPLDTPRIGAVLQVSLFDLPADAALVLTGLSTASLNLNSLGMPGCTLLTSMELVAPVFGAGGQAAYTLPIPNLALLIGITLHQQAVVPDPGANARGAVMSDAASAVIGGV